MRCSRYGTSRKSRQIHPHFDPRAAFAWIVHFKLQAKLSLYPFVKGAGATDIGNTASEAKL